MGLPIQRNSSQIADNILQNRQTGVPPSLGLVHASSEPPTAFPGHMLDQSVCMNVHLLALSCRPKSLNRSSTSSRRPSASGTDFPNEMTSSKYTRQRDQRIPHNTRSISRSNVAGALHSPNGMTRNWNNPSFVTKAAFLFCFWRHGYLPISARQVHC